MEINNVVMEIDQAEVKKLVSNLSNKEWLVRHNARKSLEKIGKPALTFLEEIADSPDYNTRWEAIKTIGDISDPSSVYILTTALNDPNVDIRWLAAEGLIEMGESSIIPLLKTIIKNYDSVDLCESAHHVLIELVKLKKYNDTTNLIPQLINRNINMHIPIAAKAKLDEVK